MPQSLSTSSESRERYENPEMPRGEVHPLTASVLVALTFLLLLSVPLWCNFTAGHESLTALLAGAVRDASAEPTLVASNRVLLRGIESFENRLEEDSPVRDAALPLLQWTLLRYGGVGNETVYAGPFDRAGDGWLVLRSGFDHLTGPPFLDEAVLERRRRNHPSYEPPLHPDPRPALLDFARQLHERGVELIFLPVPTKPAIHPEALGQSQTTVTLQNPSLEPLLDELRAAGIHVLDPHQLLLSLEREGTAAYLRTDSHWSPAAVDAVAGALSKKVTELLTASKSLPAADRDWTRTTFERQDHGDLWRLLRLPKSRPLYAEETVEVDEVTSWDGLLFEPVRGAPVLLLGDSFSTVYSDTGLHWGQAAGLAEQLAYHLGRDVDRIARPDGSSDQVRRDLAREPERLAGTQIVVYQVATRELSVGDWPRVEIPTAARLAR